MAERCERVVLDTASFITALRSRSGAAREILRRVAQQKMVLLMDLKLALEYRAVALRPEHLRVIGLSSDEVLAAIEQLERLAEPVEVAIRLRPLSVDPNDDMIIELAVAASADVIISLNVRHLRMATARFSIPVVTPAEWLQQRGR